MKTLLKYSCLLILLAGAYSNRSFAQGVDYLSSKEKVYIHTNHVFFKPGEQLYFKVYLMNAQDQTPSEQSDVVYVEIINPAGNVLQKMNYKVEDGYTEGSFDFSEQATGGVYKIRAYTTWMQNEKETVFFTKEITLQQVIAPRILMKLDFPMKGYGPGDQVSADYSIRNLSDEPIRYYEAKYTVSIGGNPIQTSRFKTDGEGKSKLVFRLPADLKSNDGLLNVVIEYDSYTEAISRSIPIVLNKIDLQFMPEGGTLVEGFSSQIAFKSLNENGKAADIKGEIWDEQGKKITAFESYHFGMGKFTMVPQPGRTYTARIISPLNIGQEYKLPHAISDGVAMSISRKGSTLLMKLNATDAREVEVIGQTKNVIHYNKKISLVKGETIFGIDEKAFPTGIACFTVYDSGDQPLAERLVFLNDNKTLQVKITTDKKKYLPREMVTMSLQTTDDKGKPVPSNFSLSVVDDKLWSFADDKQDHILSWLLMSSELKGKIEEPQFYFKKDEPKSSPALDLVMLTHGYRYFEFIDYVVKEARLKFTPDQHNILSGVVLNEKEKPVKANVFLINLNTGEKALRIRTGDDGVFFFSDVAPRTSYYLVAQSLQLKEKCVVKVLQNGIGHNPFRTNLLPQLQASARGRYIPAAIGLAPKKQDAEKVNLQIGMKDNFLNTRNELQEVVVVGYGVSRKRDVTGSITMVKGNEILQFNNLGVALQGKVAGVNVVGNANPGAAPNITIRGAATIAGFNEPLYVLNGMPVEKFDMNFNPNDIEYVTVLKDAKATAIYGAKAANGVVAIETKKQVSQRIRLDLTKQYYYTSQPVYTGGQVYTVARKFYIPKYQSVETELRNDFRETIYWNPVIQTDGNGKATVEFYNSDASTTFRAIAEGVGYNGKLGRAEATYTVQNAMSVDTKIPPYLTVGDRALLPLVIKNNTEQPLTLSIDLRLPPNVIAGDFDKELVLEADSSKQVLIPVEAIAAVKGNIGFTVGSQFNKETLSLPIVANDKGFPVIQTVSGNKSAHHNFVVNKMITGTLKSELKLFKNLEGQLLDGIESMLREPYGCFEQTSSSTYPNIYVLKYLRHSGKSNPDIERKALGLIETGYKRLIGFETAQNGFEWFGKSPAHEALTAYGLLEFTDMQEFINVDRQMLARTKKFLMDRRDGKGTFKMASGGYDAFASVPNKIANIYIVYALTQAGIGNEIELEYETAVNKAMESNDGYQLAMMALAASNMKREKDFTRLMNLLNTSYEKTKLSSETSVVNSRDASLRVESMALYALALTREKSPRLGLIAEIITKILGEKSYYGYGSTQATVLALNAVVEYSKLVGEIAATTQVAFELNGKIVMPGSFSNEIKENENVFAIRYTDDSKTIPYNFEVSYNTFTPPNSEKAELRLSTRMKNAQTKVGETVRMEIEVKNDRNILQPMAIAKVGIPAGLSTQPWQLKEIMEKNQVAYYEIFDNYLVFYWMGFAVNETKKINLDLKADIAGTYKGKASNTYLYYTPEYKYWNDGVEIEIVP